MFIKRKNRKEMSIPLLAFTFFYSVSIYAVLLSFWFGEKNRDAKTE